MTISPPQVRYSEQHVRLWLRDFQRVVLIGARFSRQEEKLGAPPPPPEEAPWAGRARMNADMEMALKRLPLRTIAAILYEPCLRHSTMRTGTSHAWRERIANLFDSTQAEINHEVSKGIEAMLKTLNGT